MAASSSASTTGQGASSSATTTTTTAAPQCPALLPAVPGRAPATQCTGTMTKVFVSGASGVLSINLKGIATGDLYACTSCGCVTFVVAPH